MLDIVTKIERGYAQTIVTTHAVNIILIIGGIQMFDDFQKTTWEIEEVILGMARIVHENRRLRAELEESSLSCAKYEALAHGKHKEYEILADIEMHNTSVRSCHSNGWLTNQDYIDDWEAEFEKRMEERK